MHNVVLVISSRVQKHFNVRLGNVLEGYKFFTKRFCSTELHGLGIDEYFQVVMQLKFSLGRLNRGIADNCVTWALIILLINTTKRLQAHLRANWFASHSLRIEKNVYNCFITFVTSNKVKALIVCLGVHVRIASVPDPEGNSWLYNNSKLYLVLIKEDASSLHKIISKS